MKTPPTNGNAIPLRCKCWMVRANDYVHREICDHHSPDSTTLLVDEAGVFELCRVCDHHEPCHGGEPQQPAS